MHSISNTLIKFLENLKIRNDSMNGSVYSNDVIFFMKTNRGYEKWMQLEFANALRKYYMTTGEMQITNADDDLQYADIYIESAYERTYVEIKCKTTNQTYMRFALGFWNDVIKLIRMRTFEHDKQIWKSALGFAPFTSANSNWYNFPYYQHSNFQFDSYILEECMEYVREQFINKLAFESERSKLRHINLQYVSILFEAAKESLSYLPRRDSEQMYNGIVAVFCNFN